jgi:hypothetical protein
MLYAGRHDQPGDLTVADDKQPKLRIQDNPTVVEVYVNKFLGSTFDGGAVTLTFGSLRAQEHSDNGASQGPVVHVTHRLALSPTATIELINGLKATLTTLTQMRKQAQGAAPQ